MSELEVKIVKLEPMRVVSFHGFGEEPENIAFQKLREWAEPKGLLDDPLKNRVFGFNNPDPSPGSPNYGYEVWIEIEASMEVEEGLTVKEFGGGLYGVTRVVGVEHIGPGWGKLVAWRESSSHRCASHQWVEQSLTPGIVPEEEITLDLHIPIAE
ncbi:MAG: GyrI-like domain-containing protein [Anaerolineales bacterium]|nr:GyrI-like domain-containing protein [Anaerolineales bacterium]